MIAENFNSFVETTTQAIKDALNNTEIGKQLSNDLLAESLKKNPNMTTDEWKEIKSQFLTFLFAHLVISRPELMEEMGVHTYNELQAET